MAHSSQDDPDDQEDQFSATVRHVVYETFGLFRATEAWSPAVNIYQLPGRLEVCVDLAGVDIQQVDVQVETGKLGIRGVRQAPEPVEHDEASMRIINMEIDYGPFRRVIRIPPGVDADRVTSEYRNGILWIRLPLRNR